MKIKNLVKKKNRFRLYGIFLGVFLFAVGLWTMDLLREQFVLCCHSFEDLWRVQWNWGPIWQPVQAWWDQSLILCVLGMFLLFFSLIEFEDKEE